MIVLGQIEEGFVDNFCGNLIETLAKQSQGIKMSGGQGLLVLVFGGGAN